MKASIIVVPFLLAGLAGCGGGGNETAKVRPNMIPEPNSTEQNYTDDNGYYDDTDYGYAEDVYVPLELFTVHFDYDKYDLNKEAMEILSENAEALAKHPNAVIRIEGHCDERGTEEYNMALGEKRAQTVRNYLLNYGVNPKNVSIISYGELMPQDRGHNEKAWKTNRRAQFVIKSE